MNDISPPDLLTHVAATLMRTRKAQRLTLEALAARSGVSRSMLSQIERGETNPTIATLWNLTRALGVDFAGLIEGAGATPDGPCQIETMAADRTPAIDARAARCQLKILSPPQMAGRTEWYDLSLEAGGKLDSQAHARGAREHLTVLSGRVTVRSGGAISVGEAGDTLRYAADVPHTISAPDGPARALLVVLAG